MVSTLDNTQDSSKEFKVDVTRWPILHYKKPFKYKNLPYGYKVPEGGDLKSLVPDPAIVSFVEEALQALDEGKTLRDVALWLSEASGRRISHVTLSLMWKKLNGETSQKIQQNIDAYSKKKRARTRPEKREYNLRDKLRTEKIRLHHLMNRISKNEEELRDLTFQEKRKARQEREDSKVLEEVKEVETNFPERVLLNPVEFREFEVAEEKEKDVAFAPNPGPQTEFLSASESEVGYGGSAGGGKSYALLADPMRYFFNPNFQGLLVRRTNDELRELKWKSKEIYKKAFGDDAVWSEKNSEWTFKGGGRFWLTYLERDEDVLRYQGQSFTWIGFDELTQYATPFAWNYLRSRLRTTDPNLPTFMRATFNPGGPGHNWVKAMFVDPAPRNQPFWATDIETGAVLTEPLTYPPGHPRQGQPNDNAGKPLFERRFVPSSVFDNPYLANTDYVQSLMALPEAQRRQLLEGDWSIAQGAAFPEFRELYHVVKPFEIPHSWTRFRSCDFGYSSHSAVHWYAIDPTYETLYVYRELYVSKMTGEQLADEVLKIERENREKINYGVLDSSVWHQRGFSGPTIAEVMNSKGCRWRPSDRSPGSRAAGRNRLHELLKLEDIDGRKVPGICFFDTCRNIIRTLPIIPTDPKGSDDIDQKFPDDHAYDSIRYGIMSRPRSNSVFDWVGDARPERVGEVPMDSVFGY